MRGDGGLCGLRCEFWRAMPQLAFVKAILCSQLVCLDVRVQYVLSAFGMCALRREFGIRNFLHHETAS